MPLTRRSDLATIPVICSPSTFPIHPRRASLAPMTCDVNVQRDGIMYLSDWNAGLHVLGYDG